MSENMTEKDWKEFLGCLADMQKNGTKIYGLAPGQSMTIGLGENGIQMPEERDPALWEIRYFDIYRYETNEDGERKLVGRRTNKIKLALEKLQETKPEDFRSIRFEALDMAYACPNNVGNLDKTYCSDYEQAKNYLERLWEQKRFEYDLSREMWDNTETLVKMDHKKNYEDLLNFCNGDEELLKKMSEVSDQGFGIDMENKVAYARVEDTIGLGNFEEESPKKTIADVNPFKTMNIYMDYGDGTEVKEEFGNDLRKAYNFLSGYKTVKQMFKKLEIFYDMTNIDPDKEAKLISEDYKEAIDFMEDQLGGKTLLQYLEERCKEAE